jgi:competence protein ComEA
MDEEGTMRKLLVLCFALALAVSYISGTAWSQEKAAQTAAKIQPNVAAQTTALVDINSATKEELAKLPGIGAAYSEKIVKGRPYAKKDQLLSKRILPKSTYDKIRDLIIAKQK